jgi:hypothetical protein
MRTTRPAAQRQRAAAEALGELGSSLREHELLSIQCGHGHHLGAVYETAAGLVVRTLTGPHAHGSKDRLDAPHHAASHGAVLADLLVTPTGADDEVPAWCDCGPRLLSRAALTAEVRRGRRTVHLR